MENGTSLSNSVDHNFRLTVYVYDCHHYYYNSNDDKQQKQNQLVELDTNKILSKNFQLLHSCIFSLFLYYLSNDNKYFQYFFLLLINYMFVIIGKK